MPHLPRLPFAAELFAQWQRARGARTTPATRPFSRSWERLLEAARIDSATARGDAEREARLLATEGWLELKTVRFKPYLIERVAIPLTAEPRWNEAFGFMPPNDEEARRIRDFDWVPEMAFVRDARVQIPFAELQRLHAFIASRPADAEMVPIKERSLEIFGDEKRLDALLNSSLFREGRLDERRDLCCEIIGVPPAWKRGPATAANGPILVVENAATWSSYARWNGSRALFSAVVYGDGLRLLDSVRYFEDLFAELGGRRRLLYFGDLDPHGLRIPQDASARAARHHLPPLEPHLWSYEQLFRRGQGCGQVVDEDPSDFDPCDWLGPLAEAARDLFRRRQRLAQERLGWNVLRAIAREVVEPSI